MNLSDLLKEDKIRKIEPDAKQAEDCLKASERDIKVAKGLINDDLDWAFTVAYNASLQAIRALMFSEGFCASGEGHHKTVIQYATVKFGHSLEGQIELFDHLRKKRHEAVYFNVGLISEFEARKAIEFAELLHKQVKEKLKVKK